MTVNVVVPALLNASMNMNKAITQPMSTSSSDAQSMMMSTRRSFPTMNSWTSFKRTQRMMLLFGNSGGLLDIKAPLSGMILTTWDQGSMSDGDNQ